MLPYAISVETHTLSTMLVNGNAIAWFEKKNGKDGGLNLWKKNVWFLKELLETWKTTVYFSILTLTLWKKKKTKQKDEMNFYKTSSCGPKSRSHAFGPGHNPRTKLRTQIFIERLQLHFSFTDEIFISQKNPCILGHSWNILNQTKNPETQPRKLSWLYKIIEYLQCING